jgi:Domain of unknown function (DUF4386)
MIKWFAEASQEPKARTNGVVYLSYFLIAVFSQYFVNRPVIYVIGNLIAFVCYIVLALLFYFMFKPVNRRLSLLAAIFSLAGCIIGVLGLFKLAPSFLNPLLFFGPYCILIGWLIFRSTFLPRILGVLMMLAGLCWLFSLTPLASSFTLYIEVLGVFAEALLMIWLIVKGVNVQQWKKLSGVPARR